MITKTRDILLLIVGILAGLMLSMSILNAFDLLISWEANTDSDLAGYNVSYDGPTSTRWTTPCDPYQVSSQGVDSATTTYTITNASNGNYAIYIRAYDTNGNMSGYTPYVGTVSGGNTWTVQGSEPTPCLPIARFQMNPGQGVLPFTSTGTDVSIGTPVSWEWTIWNTSDVSTSYTTQNISHEFEAGTSVIKLRVWNTNWFSDAWSNFPTAPTSVGITLTGGGIMP